MQIRKIWRFGQLILLSMMLTLPACASNGQRAGASMTIQTGRVVGARAVDLQSQAGRGVAVGGILGYAATSSRQSSSRRARNTILGAAAGGLIASRAEGSLTGMEYTVEIGPGATIQVVTDQTEIKVGDCVNVEQAGRGTANVRRVSEALCEAVDVAAVDADIRAEMNKSANMCLAAKERLLDAETDAQIEAAVRRVKILCDD
jgi:outer membrane lipoprotein SlyB